MKGPVPYILLAVGFLAVHPCLHGREVPLIAGNLIYCTINESNFSARTAQIGDPVVCHARPLREFGCSGFPRGTQLAGRLVGYRNPGRFFGRGWMKLEFDRLVLPNAEATIAAKVVSVEGFEVDREGRILSRSHPKRNAVGWMIPILWPVKILTLPLRGPTPALRGEKTIALRLLDDLRIPCEEFKAASAKTGWGRFGSSSEFFLDRWNSTASSGRTGKWRTFDGREVGQAAEPSSHLTDTDTR